VKTISERIEDVSNEVAKRLSVHFAASRDVLGKIVVAELRISLVEPWLDAPDGPKWQRVIGPSE